MQLRSLLCGVLACAVTAPCLPQAAALTEVSHWAATEVAAADKAALEPHTLARKAATGSITREEFCGIAVRLYQAMRKSTVKTVASGPFTDTDSTDVATAHALGLVSGRTSTLFDPDGCLTRQELCKMLVNVLSAAKLDAPSVRADALNAYSDADEVETWARDAVSLMLSCGVVNGVSTRTEDPTGEMQTVVTLSPAGTTTREQALLVSLRFTEAFPATASTVSTSAADTGTAADPEGTTGTQGSAATASGSTGNSSDTAAQGSTQATPPAHGSLPDVLPQTEAEKMAYVFGEGGSYYTDETASKAAMTEITVPVWRLQADGTKTSDTACITVNAALAGIYQAVFTEIYNGAEKFPIRDVGSYAWRASTTSEHRQGTAIDINYESNMECTIDADGNVTAITCGKSWSPDTDPYAIREGGDVYNAFTKYGFSWGGNAWKTKRDYMHFSYFGR